MPTSTPSVIIARNVKTTLDHLPQDKQDDIARIVLLIRKFVAEAREKDPNLGGTKSGSGGSGKGGIEKIILFGSHARGDWTFDSYIEDDITYEYVSDYDILIVTDDSTLPMHDDIWDKVRDRFATGRPNHGPDSSELSLIVHTIKEVNGAIEDRRYFFMDVHRDGVLLHDTPGSVDFSTPRELTPPERKERAQEEFDRWFESAKEFFDGYEFNLGKDYLNKAAFNLHQTAEHLYITASMVFTDYRPKVHDLYKLRKRVGEYDRRLLKGFAFHTPEQKRLFKLLADAYVHARYTKTYTITKEELDYLADRVRRLQAITKEACSEQIAKLV